MIDLHSHILPGVDDGAGNIGVSVEMARVAAADGVRAVVATPHVNEHYRTPPDRIGAEVEEANRALAAAGIDLTVLQGAEVALTRVTALDDEALRRLCLGDQERWLLLESPYVSVTHVLERAVFDLQTRGFSVLLAHPERSPCFRDGAARLGDLVARGVACSITAASLEGRFGRQVRRLAFEMLAHGLVHNVASDAHDSTARPPLLSAGLAELAGELDVDESYGAWLTQDVPAAIVTGQALPEREPPRKRRRGALRLLRRR